MSDELRYIPNITSAGALVLAATCAQRSTIPIRDFLQRYLGREYMFSVFTVSSFRKYISPVIETCSRGVSS
jgi:hypothetical protein